jgi:hypothetical protein
VARISPATASDLACESPEPVSAPALEEQAREAVTEQGRTVLGLAGLLGGAWTWLMEAAEGLGARIAGWFLEFLTLGDRALGDKIGWLSGTVLFALLLSYFTAGSYALLKQVETPARLLLNYLLRFLDLGGEILGVIGRQLARLGGPLLRGLEGASGLVRNLPFVGRMMDRIAGYARRLFGFADEAAEAATHAAPGARGAARSPHAPLSEPPVHAPDLPPARGPPAHAPEPPGRLPEPAPDVPAGRRAPDAASSGPGTPGRSAREAVEETPDGSLRTVDAPGPARAADDAEKVAQLFEARGLAVGIVRANDIVDTPPRAVLLELQLLRQRYRWIDGFRADRTGAGRYEFVMLASEHSLGPYTIDVGGREVEVVPSRGPSGVEPEFRASPDDVAPTPSRRRSKGAAGAGEEAAGPAVGPTGQRHIDDVQIDDSVRWNPDNHPDLDRYGLPPYDGRNTMGRLECDAGTRHVKNGTGQPGRGLYDDPSVRAGAVSHSHAEGHAAAILRETGARDGTFWINNPDGPCGFCEAVVENMLPEGSRLTVIWPGRAGGISAKTFTGNAR